MEHAAQPTPYSRPPRQVAAVAVILLMALFLTGLLPGVASSPAGAQEQPRPSGSSPANNAVVTETPGEISVTFDGDLDAGHGGLDLLDPDGEEIDLGTVSFEGPTVRAPVTGTFTEPGLHSIAYDVQLEDGRESHGEILFDYRPEGAPEPGSGLPTEQSTLPDEEPAADAPDAPVAEASPSPNPRPAEQAEAFLREVGTELPAERESFWTRGRILYGVALLIGLVLFVLIERATRPGRR